MPSKRLLVFGILLLACAAALGTSQPSLGQSKPLPPGHPPMGGSGPRPAIPEPPAGSGAGGQGLIWKSPAGWTQQAPASPMRRAQYIIPGSGGPGECAVFYFGPGQGGDAQSNATRWAGQFRSPEGSPVGEGLKTREIMVGEIPVLLVEVAGTYVGGMGGGPGGPERPNHMLLGAIAKGPDANWFFRAIGPRATIETQRPAFEDMIRSIKQGQRL